MFQRISIRMSCGGILDAPCILSRGRKDINVTFLFGRVYPTVAFAGLDRMMTGIVKPDIERQTFLTYVVWFTSEKVKSSKQSSFFGGSYAGRRGGRMGRRRRLTFFVTEIPTPFFACY